MIYEIMVDLRNVLLQRNQTLIMNGKLNDVLQYLINILGVELGCLTPLISVISWRSVLIVEQTGVPGENHRPAALTNFIAFLY
jgi:hypothetical protein